MPVQDIRKIVAAGKSLEMHKWPGDIDRPTIVLLHEGLGSLGLWRDFPEALAQSTGCTVMAYSRAGYGYSDPADLPRPLDYMTREALDVLPDVLRQTDPGPLILLGHSDGATIAAIYTGSVSDFRVRGQILMAPHFFTEPIGLAQIAAARGAFEAGGLREKLARHHKDPDATFRGWNDAWLDPDFKDWDVAEVIDYFRIPTLAIQGSEDPYGTRVQIDEIERRSYAPVDMAYLADCGHAPHLDRREATLAAISGFTNRLVRIESAVGVPA